VGLLTTVGLSAKTRILIVEFAQAQIDHGLGLFEATLTAVRLRLRPILMTSLAFGWCSTAGADDRSRLWQPECHWYRRAWRMISATVLGIFFVPVFFVVIR